MPLFTWGPQYSVLVDEMDNQHKKLFDYINELNEAMMEGKGNAALSGILGKLEGYTREHFKSEEELLKKQGYPDLERQVHEHKNFVEKVSQMRQDQEAGKMMVSLKTLSFLREWLQNHIMKQDRNYGNWMKENGLI